MIMKKILPLILFIVTVTFIVWSLRSPRLGGVRRAYALESGWSITAPGTVTFPSTAWSLATSTNVVSFGSAVEISNNQSTSQGFNGDVYSTEFIHQTEPTLFIGYTKLEIKTGGVTSSQTDGVTTPLNNLYNAFSGSLSTSSAINFISADARYRTAGTWSITPTLRLTIPSKQRAGTYNATLTFSLY